MDKIKIITKNGGACIGSSWLTKMLIDVCLSKYVIIKQNMDYFDISA